MLVEPPRTNYDLNFRLLGFPVRVHPLFWLGAVLIGASAMERGPEFMLIWVAVVFVSILVHELGHAVAFRRFGVESHLVLYVFGGLAVPWGDVRGRWRRVAVALAGPVAGFVLLGLVWGSNRVHPWAATNPHAFALFVYLVLVNLYWGVLNLLPVVPLDGGRVSEEVCGTVWRQRGLRVSLRISMVVAGLVAAYSLLCYTVPNSPVLASVPWWFPAGGLWTAMLFAVLAVQSYQLLQQTRWADTHWTDS